VKVVIDKKALKYVNGLKESDRRLVKEHIVALVNPHDTIGVFEVTTIEEAHKRYKRYRK